MTRDLLTKKALLGFLLLTFIGAPALAQGVKLNDLIMQVVETYPEVLAKKSNQDAAGTDFLAAKLRFLPALQVSKQNTTITFSNGNTGYLPSSNIQANLPVFYGGANIAGYAQARAALSSADFQILESQADVTRRVIAAYAEWYKAYLKILALKSGIDETEKLVSLITRRYDAGVAALADKNLAVSRWQMMLADLADQEANEKKSLTAITQLVGQPITRADLVGEVAIPLVPPHREDLLLHALDGNPTVNRFKQDAIAAEKSAEVARAQTLPQISFQMQRQIGNSYAPGYPGYNAAGLVLTYTGGGGFANVASTFSAYSRGKSAEISIETTKRDLTNQVNADYDDYESGRKKVSNLTQAEELVSGLAKSFDRQYMIGKKSWMDLMNEVREKYQAQAALADSKGSLLSTSWRLLTYSGDLYPWQYGTSK